MNHKVYLSQDYVPGGSDCQTHDQEEARFSNFFLVWLVYLLPSVLGEGSHSLHQPCHHSLHQEVLLFSIWSAKYFAQKLCYGQIYSLTKAVEGMEAD